MYHKKLTKVKMLIYFVGVSNWGTDHQVINKKLALKKLRGLKKLKCLKKLFLNVNPWWREFLFWLFSLDFIKLKACRPCMHLISSLCFVGEQPVPIPVEGHGPQPPVRHLHGPEGRRLRQNVQTIRSVRVEISYWWFVRVEPRTVLFWIF